MADDFITYAKRALFIASKNSGLQSLVLNKAQLYLHHKLEEQKKLTGKVRAVILKGRQQGCSTYIAGRFYHQASNNKGIRVFIITHSQDATNNLFGIVDKFYNYCPEELKPKSKIASAKEKYFSELASGYRVGTAGSKSVGRSQTIQLLHASEVAFWPNATEHFAGLVQAVADMPGTEIILESTAYNLGNKFHNIWQDAVLGISEYLPIFIPWYWQDEYRKIPPKDWQISKELEDYAKIYNLDISQIYWRECKKIELGGDFLFNREYPSDPDEAFCLANEDSFITSNDVLVAKQDKYIENFGPRLAGCDPARFGADRTSFCFRWGRSVEEIVSYSKQDTMQVVGLCCHYIDKWNLDKLFIDVVGLGAGVYDRLKELGFSHKIMAVNASSAAFNKEKYLNKRAEMWDLMRSWLKDQPCKIPNYTSLSADLLAPLYNYDSLGRLVLEKKEEMKKRGLRSPDEADALALTFAYPVKTDFIRHNNLRYPEMAKMEYSMYDMH